VEVVEGIGEKVGKFVDWEAALVLGVSTSGGAALGYGTQAGACVSGCDRERFLSLVFCRGACGVRTLPGFLRGLQASIRIGR
jgi:hypothetical protein